MQKKHRRIPYGVMNWAEIVRTCHFVDNTGYIRALENCKMPIFLRPKRFGKTVVCSMLAHYYDIALKDRFDEFFGMTDIGRDPTATTGYRLRGLPGPPGPPRPPRRLRSCLKSQKSQKS